MSRLRTVLLATALQICCFNIEVSADFVIVQDGRAKATIILGADHSDLENHAAQELAKYVQQMSGAALDIAQEAPPDAEYLILLGQPTTNEAIAELVTNGALRLEKLEQDAFAVKTLAADGKRYLSIVGGSDAGILYGTYQLLEQHCKVGFFEDGDHVPKRDTIRLPQLDYRKGPSFAFRKVFQGCALCYTAKYWSLDDWKQEIDWALKKGFNVFSINAGFLERYVVRARVYPKLGVIRDPLAPGLHEYADLLGQAHRYAQSRGMGIIVPTFLGWVDEEFKQRYPDIKYFEMQWLDYPPSYHIDFTDATSREVLADTLKLATQEAHEQFGEGHYYYGGPFGEVDPGDSPERKRELKAAFGAMQAACLWEADPQAILISSGWPFTWDPDIWTKDDCFAFLDTLKGRNVIVEEIWTEERPIYKRLDYFGGMDWSIGILQTFGANNSLSGDIPGLVSAVRTAVNDPKANRCIGYGINPEGVAHDPLYYDVATALAWNPKTFDLGHHVEDYAERRYGAEGKKLMVPALNELLKSAYSASSLHPPYYHHRMVFPEKLKEDAYAPRQAHIPHLRRALTIGMQASHALDGNPLYHRDMIDIAKQYISEKMNRQLVALYHAYQRSNVEAFEESAGRIATLFDSLERLLASDATFQLQPEIEAGERIFGTGDQVAPGNIDWTKTDTSVAREVRTRYTVLSDLEHWTSLLDYASKDAYELVRYFYRKRIEVFIDHLRARIDDGDAKAVDESALRGGYHTVIVDFVENGYELEGGVLLREGPIEAVQATVAQLREAGLMSATSNDE